jgi:hypothetical protein
MPALQLRGGNSAHSSAIGGLLGEARQLLGGFRRWRARRVGASASAQAASATAQAAKLCRDALWPEYRPVAERQPGLQLQVGLFGMHLGLRFRQFACAL